MNMAYMVENACLAPVGGSKGRRWGLSKSTLLSFRFMWQLPSKQLRRWLAALAAAAATRSRSAHAKALPPLRQARSRRSASKGSNRS